MLKTRPLETKLGSMVAISDDEALYLLEFAECRGLEREIERLKEKTKSLIIPGDTRPLRSIENELDLYFMGQLKEFSTPIFFLGSDFQKQVWEELKKIPYAETRSYSDIAKSIGKSTAFRAVAQANGANQIAIVIPCHRVINASGELGGYAGGVTRKKWLITHENQQATLASSRVG